MTVSKAADRSSRMRIDDLESAFAIRRASVTERSAVSVEWPLLKPDFERHLNCYFITNNDKVYNTCIAITDPVHVCNELMNIIIIL